MFVFEIFRYRACKVKRWVEKRNCGKPCIIAMATATRNDQIVKYRTNHQRMLVVKISLDFVK